MLTETLDVLKVEKIKKKGCYQNQPYQTDAFGQKSITVSLLLITSTDHSLPQKTAIT